MDKILDKIGEEILVQIQPKVNGIASLNSWSDVLIGVTADRYVSRKFRLTPDGLFYTDWAELTNINLSKLSELKVNDLFCIQIVYKRLGTDETGVIEFSSIDFSGSFENKIDSKPTVDKGIFSGLYNDPETESIARNLFKKLYYRGIIPKYITRGDNSDFVEDEDYISLFSSIAKFFALIIKFSKRFETFNSDFSLMRDNVRQTNLYFDESVITLPELQYLSAYLYDEIRKRGTNLIFKKKGYVLKNGKTTEIDGEFLRLYKSTGINELVTSKLSNQKVGWCLGRCSPLYRGTNEVVTLNKTKENSEDFISKDNYNITEQGSDVVIPTEFENKKCFRLVSNGNYCGIGKSDLDSSETDLITVNSNLDYEITFDLLVSNTDGNSSLLFKVDGFDNLKNKMNDSFVLPNGDSITNEFMRMNLGYLKQDTWFKIRGIIHSYSTKNFDNLRSGYDFGNRLYFYNKFVKFIAPSILVKNADILIHNYKIRPLVFGTNILPRKGGEVNAKSNGFIQASNIFYMFVENNNSSLSNKEVNDFAERYLLPYNFNNIFVNI